LINVIVSPSFRVPQSFFAFNIILTLILIN
jgi:hypothetical protein